MPGCIVSAITASFRSVEKRRRRATPVITSTFENVSDIGVYLGLCLGPPAKAGVRSKQGAVHAARGIAGDYYVLGGNDERIAKSLFAEETGTELLVWPAAGASSDLLACNEGNCIY